MTVHLPVPFWPAVSRILSTSGVPSVVLLGENVAGDLDEIGVEFALVPFGEDVVHLVGAHAEAVLHHVVGLADELHVAVFDAVVDHLHVMAGAAFADPIAARDVPSSTLAAMPWKMSFTCGHAAGEPPGMMLGPCRAPSSPPRHAGADVEQALALDVFHAAIGVLEERIAAVDDDVAGFEMREELLDEFVHGLAGLDEHHDAARALQLADHFLDGMRADDLGALGFLGEELVHLGRRCG